MTEQQRNRPVGETSGTSQRPSRRLAAPALTFDLADQIATLKQENSWQRSDRNARTLVEEPAFRLVLTVLKDGARLREHSAAGWVSVECLQGKLRLQIGGDAVDLSIGQLVVLQPDLAHTVTALGEAAFLLTIALSGHVVSGKQE